MPTALATQNTNNLGNNQFSQTGTHLPEVRFFWVTNDSGQQSEQRQVSAIVTTVLGLSVLETVTFNVQEPTYSFTVTQQGTTTTYTYINGTTTVRLGDNSVNPIVEGISITGSFQTGQVIGSGAQGKILQLATPGRSGTALPFGGTPSPVHFPLSGQTLLDAADPYTFYWVNNAPAQMNGNAAIFGAGASQTMVDFPESPLTDLFVDLPGAPGTREKATQETIADAFQTYLMFKPPGDSRWVTLYIQKWSWNASVSLVQRNYVINNPAGPTHTGAVPTDEPTWSGRIEVNNLPNWVP